MEATNTPNTPNTRYPTTIARRRIELRREIEIDDAYYMQADSRLRIILGQYAG